MTKPSIAPTTIRERARTVRSRREVFAFFDRPENLKRVTPRSLAVSLLSAPADLRPGTIFAYRLQRWPLDLSWDVVVSEYSPPGGFTNVKARGYFPRWVLQHRIDAVPGGTELELGLEYEVPPGLYNSLTNSYVIREAMRELLREQTQAIAAALDRGE